MDFYSLIITLIPALDAVKLLLSEVQTQLDKTREKGETVLDIEKRFYDLQNNSRFSLINAQDGFDIVSRLKAVTLEILDVSWRSLYWFSRWNLK